MQARGTKQRELVEETPREFPWIESGSLVRDFWALLEYGNISESLSRLKARGHALILKWGQDILLEKNWRIKREDKKNSVHYQVGCNGSGNGCWNCVRNSSRKRVQQVM